MTDVTLIPALTDNYIYVFEDQATGVTAVIDPAEAAPAINWFEEKRLVPGHILITHHHWDHTGGVAEMKAKYGSYVWGPEAEAARIEDMDAKLSPGEIVAIGETKFKTIAVPGHTSGHIGYYAAGPGVLFCGDALFAMGCGRMFEGTPAEMWASLQRIRDLPDETRIYCGHEYTMSNLKFAESLSDPGMADALAKRRAHLTSDEMKGQPTLPTLLSDETETNPFLRADDPGLAETLGMSGRTAVDVFAKLRAMKDAF